MKKTAILVMSLVMISSTVPVFAQQKDECLLASRNCKNAVDSIQQKIKALDREIKKGKRVYTVDELNRLKDKLKAVNDELDNLLKPGH